MREKFQILLMIFLICAAILSSCSSGPPKSKSALTSAELSKPEGGLTSAVPSNLEGVLTSAELLADPVYDTPIKVYGQVTGLGEFKCKCFALNSGDAQIYVWFDMMVEEDGSPTPPTRTPVNVDGIENGDWIVVSGELKFFEDFKVHKDFWLTKFEILQKNK
jgi:hypothetical protein